MSWMNTRSEADYRTKKQTRLGGLGPAIAQLQNHYNGQDPHTTWDLPLAEPCDEIIGSFSINNMPAPPNQYNQTFYPVFIEFKLSTVEQRVKKQSRVKRGLWVGGNDDPSEQQDSHSDNDITVWHN